MGKLLKILLIPFLIVLIFSISQSEGATLKVVPEPGTDPVHLEMVQKTVSAFNDALKTDMGITLEENVTIFLCPTRESYRQVLQRELGQSSTEAERNSKVTGGFSRGQSKAVVINFDLSSGASPESRAYKTTAHELFHQVQYQLAKDNMGKGYYWMKEGTADLVGANIATKVGYQSLEKWKLDQVNILRKAESHVLPQEILITNLDKWTTLLEEKQHPYEMSDLMLLYLLKERGSNGYREIGDYYRLIGQGIANDLAFERTFGISPTNIIEGFEAWFVEITAQSPSIEILAAPDIAIESINDFNQGADLTRQFFMASWGKDLSSSMRLVLTSGKPSYAAAMVKEFGISMAEGEERAKNSTWWYSGSTTIYELGSLTTKQQRIFSISNSLIRRFANETAPQKKLEQLYWLVSGSADAIASFLVERSGTAKKDYYKNSWLASVAKVGTLPELSELSTLQSWNQAKSKYGSTVISRTAALAALYLLDKYGVESLINWCKAVKERGDGEIAFQQVFHLSTAQFSEEFSMYLRKELKRAL